MDITQNIKGVYDNGGETADRYTVVFNDIVNENLGTYMALGLSENPENPQWGISMWVEAVLPNEYLGKKIEYSELPKDLQKHVEDRYFGKESSLEGMEKMASVEWEEGAVLKELVNQFGKEFKEEIKDSLALDDGQYSNLGDMGKFTADGIEYNVIKDEEEAEKIALDLVKEDLENEPELFTQSWLQQYVYISNTDKRIISNEEADNYVENLDDDDALEEAKLKDEYDELQEQIDEMENKTDELLRGPDEGYDGKEFEVLQGKIKELEEQKENLISQAKDDIISEMSDRIEKELENPIQYFVHDQGIYSVEDLMKQSFIGIDIDEAAQGAIDEDGWAHFLSRYDGNYDTTKNGLVYFRES